MFDPPEDRLEQFKAAYLRRAAVRNAAAHQFLDAVSEARVRNDLMPKVTVVPPTPSLLQRLFSKPKSQPKSQPKQSEETIIEVVVISAKSSKGETDG